MSSDPVSEILARQQQWAQVTAVPLDQSGLATQVVDDNLFRPLSAEARQEFSRGAGGELGTPDAPGPMTSLLSSAALVVNVFDPWRGHGLAPLATVLGSDPSATRLRMEVTFPTGLQGVPPHLDVVIDRPGGHVLAIESKFTEPYDHAVNEFRPSYFRKQSLWDSLPRLRELAERIDAGEEVFEHLGAAQLIKHTLGLKRSCGVEGFTLLYLWYEWPSPMATAHRTEIVRFAATASFNIDFRALTYQELFEDLKAVPEPTPGYLDYLRARYFGSDSGAAQ